MIEVLAGVALFMFGYVVGRRQHPPRPTEDQWKKAYGGLLLEYWQTHTNYRQLH